MPGTATHASKARRWRLAGALLALAMVMLAAGVWLLPEESAKSAPGASQATRAEETRSPPPAPRREEPLALSEPGPAASAAQPPGAPRGQMPQHLLEQIREEDALMGAFHAYSERALLDSQRLAQYQALLSAPGNISAVEQALMSAGEGEMTLREHFHRLMRIDFLKAALAWEQNPSRAQVLEAVSRLLLDDPFTEAQSEERQHALAGGKMELYHLLARHAPQQALAMVEEARGTRIEKLITFLAERDQRLRSQQAHRAEPSPPGEAAPPR